MNIKQQVIKAKQNGMSYNEIQRHYGIPRSTAFDWVKAYNAESIVKEDFDVIASFFEDGIEGHVNENLQREKPTRFKVTGINGDVYFNDKSGSNGATLTPDTTIKMGPNSSVRMSGMGMPECSLRYTPNGIEFSPQYA